MIYERISGDEQLIGNALRERTAARWEVFVTEHVDSTMNIARSFYKEWNQGPAVVVAYRQTQGRGRLGRVWYGGEGNLAATFLFPAFGSAARWGAFSLVSALAMQETLAELGCSVGVKWPNDVLTLEGRKLSGILLELVGEPQQRVVLLGLGVNLVDAPSSAPESIALSALIHRTISVQESLVLFGAPLWRSFQEYSERGFAEFRQRWLSTALYLNRNIAVAQGESSLRGVFRGITDEGEMLLECEKGTRVISTGDLALEGEAR